MLGYPRLLSLGLAICILDGCAVESSTPRDNEVAASEVATPVAENDARALPAGAGRPLLEDRCTTCHDLNGLWAYQGYYDEASWRAMIETMITHGATLDVGEIDVLTAYLVEYFGPGTR